MAKPKAPPPDAPANWMSRAIEGGAKLSISTNKKADSQLRPLFTDWRTKQVRSRPAQAPPSPVTRSDEATRKSRPRTTQAPPPGPMVSGRGVAHASTSPQRVVRVSKPIALIQVRALIAAFQEAESYDPRIQHNQPAPALWADDEDYLRNIKELIRELRRFNDLLEARKENSEAIAKSGGLLVKMGERFCLSAADAAGGGAVKLLAFASLCVAVSYTDWGADLIEFLPDVGIGKRK